MKPLTPYITTFVTASLMLLAAASTVEAQSKGGEALDGRWVYLEEVTTVSDLPVLGDVRSTVRAVAIYDLSYASGASTEGAGDLRGSGELCELESSSDSRFLRTVLPPALVKNYNIPELALEVDAKGEGVSQRRQYRVLGANLNDPKRELLPLKRSDKRVIDHDKDGHPGITVAIRGIVDGEIYLVQRQWTELRGSVIGAGDIRGMVIFGKEESVLGATHSALESAPTARLVPSASKFRMVRVPGGLTCAQAVRAARSGGF